MLPDPSSLRRGGNARLTKRITLLRIRAQGNKRITLLRIRAQGNYYGHVPNCTGRAYNCIVSGGEKGLGTRLTRVPKNTYPVRTKHALQYRVLHVQQVPRLVACRRFALHAQVCIRTMYIHA